MHKVTFQKFPLVALDIPITEYSSEQRFPTIPGAARKIDAYYRLHSSAEPAQVFKRGNPRTQTLPGQATISLTQADGHVVYFRVLPNTPSIPKHLDTIFGQRVAVRHIAFSYARKAKQYPNFNAAYNDITSALKHASAGNFALAQPLYESAIKRWQITLDEADLSNKKSRINRKVAAAAYDNLVPTLVLAGRYVEARQKNKEYRSRIGGFRAMNSAGHNTLIDDFSRNNRAQSQQLTIRDTDLLHQPRHASIDDLRQIRKSREDLNTLAIGSWIILFESEAIPQLSSDPSLLTQNPCLEQTWLHLLPDHQAVLQAGSWDTDCPQRINLDDKKFWIVETSHETEDVVLKIAEQEDSFDDPTLMDEFVLINISQERLIFRGKSLTGAHPGRTVMQFERIRLLTIP